MVPADPYRSEAVSDARTDSSQEQLTVLGASQAHRLAVRDHAGELGIERMWHRNSFADQLRINAKARRPREPTGVPPRRFSPALAPAVAHQRPWSVTTRLCYASGLSAEFSCEFSHCPHHGPKRPGRYPAGA